MSQTEVTAQRAPALVIQFAKWPQGGRVKTRLMPALGERGALSAHLALTGAVLGNLQATGLPLAFWWDRAAPAKHEGDELLRRLQNLGIPQGVQTGTDLGERMTRALSGGLEHYERVVIVGSDCPSVDPDYVHQAVAELEENDLVLGPSEDGGYVLIGARRVVPGLLADINWGTEQVRQQTLARAQALGLSCTCLPERWDVDEPEDWQRFLALSRR